MAGRNSLTKQAIEIVNSSNRKLLVGSNQGILNAIACYHTLRDNAFIAGIKAFIVLLLNSCTSHDYGIGSRILAIKQSISCYFRSFVVLITSNLVQNYPHYVLRPKALITSLFILLLFTFALFK